MPSAGTAVAGPKRDIYFLVFDRYGSQRALELDYGITDNDMYDWLESKGFYVARQAHANYWRTGISIKSTLNMNFLDNVGPEASVRGAHAVGLFLKRQGYRYVHIGSQFGPTRSSTIADQNWSLDGASDFAQVFHDTTCSLRSSAI